MNAFSRLGPGPQLTHRPHLPPYPGLAGALHPQTRRPTLYERHHDGQARPQHGSTRAVHRPSQDSGHKRGT